MILRLVIPAVLALNPVVPLADNSLPGPLIIYVDADAQGANDGTCWLDAYGDLQDALDEANALGDLGQTAEVWVAEGLYKPDRGTGDRVLAFEVHSNVSVYGGFAGDELTTFQRCLDQHPTILSGDLAGDDVDDPIPTADCCDQANPASCSDAWCNQRIAEYFAAILRLNTCALFWSPFCAYVANSVCCDICRPSRCENSYNVMRIVDTDSTPIVDGLVMTSGEPNGQIEAALDNGLFRIEGGGLYVRNATPTISECEFRSHYRGGASIRNTQDLVISDCRFVNNHESGLDIDIGSGHLDIRRMEFAGNKSTGCSIHGLGGTARIEDSLFTDNSASGLIATADAIAVVRTDFVNNQLGGFGGGVNCRNNATFVHCVFRQNHASHSGGGMYYDGFLGGQLIVADCLFDGNTSGLSSTQGTGGALHQSVGKSTLINSLFTNNYAARYGGAIFGGTDTKVFNTIFLSNSDFFNGAGTTNAQVATASAIAFAIDYSIVEGWDGTLGGEGNSGVDPLFVDPLGPDGVLATGDENYRLSNDSPAINAGHPNPPILAVRDLDGHRRTLCGATDLGPYEWGIADFDCNGVIDLSDYAQLPGCLNGPGAAPIPIACRPYDFDADDVLDLIDVAEFQSTFSP